MVCDDGVRQSGRCMEHADGVPGAAAQSTLSDNGDGPLHCPECGGYVSPGEPCKRCMHLNRARRTDTREAIQAGADLGFGDPLNNPVAARIYGRYASVVTREDREVSLRPGGGFSTNLQGRINVDPYPLGPGAPVEDQIVATWGGIEHELAHEEWSPRQILHAASRIGRGQTDRKYSGFSGSDLSERARGHVQEWLNVIEDGRVERLLQENVPGAFKRVRAQDMLSSRWDEEVGDRVPVYHQVVGAALYDALPNYAVQRHTYEAMSDEARQLFDRVRPLVRRGVSGDAAGALKAAAEAVKVLDEAGVFSGPQHLPATVEVHPYTGSMDADGGESPSGGAPMPVPVNAGPPPELSDEKDGDEGSGGKGGPQNCPECGGFLDKNGNCTKCDWAANQVDDAQSGQSAGGGGGEEADEDTDEQTTAGGQADSGDEEDDEEDTGSSGGDGGEGDRDAADGEEDVAGSDGSSTDTDKEQDSASGGGDQDSEEDSDGDGSAEGGDSAEQDTGGGGGGGAADSGSSDGGSTDGDQGGGGGDRSSGSSDQGAEEQDRGVEQDGSGDNDEDSPSEGERAGKWDDFPEYDEGDQEDVQREAEDVLSDLRDEAARTYANAVRDYAEETSRNDAQKIHDGSQTKVRVQFAEGPLETLEVETGPQRVSPIAVDKVGRYRTEYAGAARRFARELRNLKSEVQADRPFQRRGRFDRRRMKSAVKGDDRVYYKRGVDIDQDVAVAIQVDRSSSMRGDAIREAVKAATITSMALEQSDIPYEIRSFYGSGEQGHQVLHKEFTSPKASDEDLASMLHTQGSTPMKRAAEITRASMSVREEGINLVFVLADGGPNGYNRSDPFTPVRKAFDGMEEQGMTPVLVFTSPREMTSGVRNMLDQTAGQGRWEHVQNPASLHRIVSDRIRDIYRNAGQGRGR
jgi:Mg-chelatase subunit ChlD